MENKDLAPPAFRWTWRDDLKLLRYNWIKRPWRNFLALIGVRKIGAGKMDRSDFEWAYRAAHEVAACPFPSNGGQDG